MFKDILRVIISLPSQHVIYGTISLVLCIAATWVYKNSSHKIKVIIIQTIGYLAIFNEIAFQIYMFYYGIWSPSTSLPLEMCYISALLVPFYSRKMSSRDLKNWFFFCRVWWLAIRIH